MLEFNLLDKVYKIDSRTFQRDSEEIISRDTLAKFTDYVMHSQVPRNSTIGLLPMQSWNVLGNIYTNNELMFLDTFSYIDLDKEVLVTVGDSIAGKAVICVDEILYIVGMASAEDAYCALDIRVLVRGGISKLKTLDFSKDGEINFLGHDSFCNRVNLSTKLNSNNDVVIIISSRFTSIEVTRDELLSLIDFIEVQKSRLIPHR